MEPRWIPLEKEVSKSKGERLVIARHRIMGDPLGSGGEEGEKTSRTRRRGGEAGSESIRYRLRRKSCRILYQMYIAGVHGRLGSGTGYNEEANSVEQPPPGCSREHIYGLHNLEKELPQKTLRRLVVLDWVYCQFEFWGASVTLYLSEISCVWMNLT